MPAKPLSLYELNALVRGTLEATLDGEYWLVAELSEVRVAAGGHCYVEFVEKSPDGGALIAKARGCIWRNVYPLLALHFESETGRKLAPGMQVLVKAAPVFHELYGYSLNVTDIDPAYSLGDLARRRKEILRQLEEDGVLTLNKELPLPRPLLRIAVISSPTAAGYGDFCHQLEQSGCAFRVGLFAAAMQGDAVEASIIAALDRIAGEEEVWDAVAIIRGGGAVSDLNGFDSYLLAANVAQFPLPVLTGIGHERDDTVIDLVAHTRLKTPTAVAAFLVERQLREEELVADLQRRIAAAVGIRLQQAGSRLQATGHRLQLSAASYGSKEREKLLRLSLQAERLAAGTLSRQRQRLEQAPGQMAQALGRRFAAEGRKLEYMEKLIRMAGPERILQMGFSLTLLDGKAVKDASVLKPGDRIQTCLASGRVESKVEALLPPEEQ